MLVNHIAEVDQRLRRRRARKKWYRRWVQRSAVSVILRRVDDGLEMLMIRRAEWEGDPWSGHMAFPGGRTEDIDPSDLETARRETLEEICLDTRRDARYLGQLSDVTSPPRWDRKPMVITPHVFALPETPALAGNYEVAEIVWVPLQLFADPDKRQEMALQVGRRVRFLPCYYFGQRCIWGLSLRMIDELVGLLR